MSKPKVVFDDSRIIVAYRQGANEKQVYYSIKARIRDLKKLDLATVNDAYLERQIRELLDVGYVSRLLYINLPRVYRVRINENNKPFKNTRQLWWPPPGSIKEIGRLNRIGESVFYCSDSEDTAIIEKQPRERDVLTVLEAALIDPSKQALVTELGVHEFSGKSNPKYGGTPPGSDLRLKQFTKSEGISQTNPLLRDYLTKEFLKDVAPNKKHQYKTTIAIAHILINDPEIVNEEDGMPVPSIKIDGLSYPSIASEKLGANFALRIEAADRLYKPVACTVYRVEKRKTATSYTVGTLMKSESIQPNGTIDW